jgi:two-component system sensor histidine kinase KdpD
MPVVLRWAHMKAPTPLSGQPWFPWLAVVALLSAATVSGSLLDNHVSLTSEAMLYVLVVVLASYTLEYLPSVVCAVAAVTAFNFFFVPPRWTFEVDSQEHLLALLVMLAVALLISHQSALLRRETRLAHLNALRATRVQELASQLANATRAADVLAAGQSAFNQAFAGPCMLALLPPDAAAPFAPDLPADVREGLQSCMRDAAALGPGTGRWPGLNAWYLPLGHADPMCGAVCIQNIAATDFAGRAHAQALCALLAQTLWRLRLSQEMQKSHAEAQHQQVQSTFLAAISHDLRTPLAAVVGAASALQTQGDKLSATEQARLLASIVSEASHLSSITENTLQLVQLTNAAQPPRRDWESMEEIVGAVLARLRVRDSTRRIQSKVPDGLPLIQVDAVLIAQLIANLLDNALKYSTDAIQLQVRLSDGAMQVCVKDRGHAIPLPLQQSIFEPYARNDQSGQRGAGLGLALGRAIASVHGGSLTLHPRRGGGNSFCFSLPLSAQQPAGEMP